MIKYAAFTVQLHGLNERSLEDLRAWLQDTLRKAVRPAADSDVMVDIAEYAGSEEP